MRGGAWAARGREGLGFGADFTGARLEAAPPEAGSEVKGGVRGTGGAEVKVGEGMEAGAKAGEERYGGWNFAVPGGAGREQQIATGRGRHA